MKPVSVSFIGSGNVAWHLAPALENVGYAVREVFSRKEKHAMALAEKLYECEVTTSLDLTESASQLFIIAVPDDAVAEVVSELSLPEEAMLVHTSGSSSLSLLENSGAAFTGVFYPLMTFTKGRRMDFNSIPFFIESEEEACRKVLTAMAKAISSRVYQITSSERMHLHAAAVFASNFTNHMLTISAKLLKDQALPFDILKPLIAETINKSLEMGPEKGQTGPARRGDLEVLDRHLALLEGADGIAEIYKVVSQHIIDYYEVE
jgi:predicted short-subunit dehydrogenase-like oxidoreductase (DUF2520 family)